MGAPLIERLKRDGQVAGIDAREPERTLKRSGFFKVRKKFSCRLGVNRASEHIFAAGKTAALNLKVS